MRAPTKPAFAAAIVGCLVAGIVTPAAAGRPVAARDVLRSVWLSRSNGPRTVPGEVLVRFKKGRSPVRAADIGASSLGAQAVDGWKLVHLQANETTEQAIARLGGDPSVAEVTANHVYHSLAIPTDSLFPLQWGLRNTGQTINGDWGSITGTAAADISATSAWDTTTGSASVIVGVVDSGVAATHPDLKPNVVAGYNFVGDRTTGDTHDVLGHGSHVAGIIGAAGNDGYGVTGVSPHVKILPLRALDDSGSGDTYGIAQAFSYAATHGAKVVNASLGGSDPDPVLEQAIAGHPNTLFVVAAGNSASNNDFTPTYPCNYTLANLICVAASDQKDDLASFSNYGSAAVDLAAPGENIASTYVPDVAGYGGSGYSIADSPNGAYANNADTWAQSSSTIDPGGATDCVLAYELRARLGPNDVLTAETAASSTPDSWGAVDTFGNSWGATTSGTFTSRTAPVSADGSPFNVRFHLVSDGSGTNDGVYVDDVSVACGGSTIYGPDTFGSTLTGWTTGGTADWGTTNVVGTWVYMSGTSMATPFVSGVAALIWAYQPASTVAHVKNAILGSVDRKSAFIGKTYSGGRLNAVRALQYAADYTAPTGVAITTPTASQIFKTSTSFTVGWKATDAGTGVKGYYVRYRRANYNGAFGAWTTWKNNTIASSATFTGSPGSSYCFQVRAFDRESNLSGWSIQRCTAPAVNDTALAASAGWSRLKSSTRYLGTYSYTTRRYATLSLSHVSFRALGLVVTVCKGCGSVAVYVGSTYYGTFSLNWTSTATKHVTLVRASKTLVGPTTVTIKVVSSGTPVSIEGLGLIRY